MGYHIYSQLDSKGLYFSQSSLIHKLLMELFRNLSFYEAFVSNEHFIILDKNLQQVAVLLQLFLKEKLDERKEKPLLGMEYNILGNTVLLDTKANADDRLILVLNTIFNLVNQMIVMNEGYITFEFYNEE